MEQHPSYPGGSKTKVDQAGNKIRQNNFTDDDLQTIDKWREAHRIVLNTFQSILRMRTRNIPSITVAQRHKRRSTIFDKLMRHPNMRLSSMDDVAGCRLIFDTIDELHAFRARLHTAKFKHRLRNPIDKYDYIQHPKPTGYRGIHDVYIYNVKSRTNQNCNGLNVEIQYRTRIQHAWSTTVEIIGLITENQPKFQRGNDDRYERSMVYASEILARAHENMKGPLPDIENNELVKSFITLSNEIHLLQRLKGLNTTNTEISKKKNAILIFKTDGTLEIKTFKDAPDALTSLFILEKEIPHDDIVLVRADTSQEVREAYKNYFSDARDFIRLIEEGCEKLYANTLLLDTLDKYNTDKDTTVNPKKVIFSDLF